MKIVSPICCGIDVHKSFLVATIVSVTKLDYYGSVEYSPDKLFALLAIKITFLLYV